MQFDMNAAWRDATAMISANRDVLLVVAGLFFFLPSVAMTMLAPGMQQMPTDIGGEQALEAMLAVYQANAPLLIVVTLLQAVGVLALLALLRHSSRPTVGEALKIGVMALLPYIAAQLLVGLAAGIFMVFAIAIGAATGVGVITFVLGTIAVVGFVYLWVKFSLVSPVIAIDRTFNPLTALQRSWQLTKGNSLRLFAFFLLVIVAIVVVGLILSLVIGLLAALLGTGTAGLLVTGIFSGALGAAYTVLFMSILAAVHRQLSGGTTEDVSATFE